MRDRKPYCKEGESESHIALGRAMVLGVIGVALWFLFLWATGFIAL